MAPRRGGDRRRRHLRLGPAVARGVERAGPGLGRAGQSPGHLGAVDDLRVELVFARVIEPGFELGEIGLGVPEIHDPAGAEPGLGLDQLVHPLPQPQAFDDERKFARVAHHLAAPSPIAARLLAGDVPLLAQRHRDAPLREEEGRAGADNAAADDDHVGARRQGLVG